MKESRTVSGAAAIRSEQAALDRQAADWRAWWEEVSELGMPHFGEMGDRLSQFRRELAAHMTREEALIPELSPEGVFDLSQLRDQHADLIGELDRLIGRLHACEPEFDCWSSARAEFESFLGRLREHEAAEEALLERLS